MKNLFFEYLDVDKVKKAINNCPEDEVVILLPHYSINIQSKYEDGEDCQFDWKDFENELGEIMFVNDYDDLCVDPHGIYEY